MKINDIDENGFYDVKDFLEMKNEDIIKMNLGKKFDVCLMNPPYDGNMHYDFTMKCLNIAENVISVMPNSIIWRDSKHFLKYKKAYNTRLYEVEEVSSSVFNETHMLDIAVFSFKNNTNELTINYLNKPTEYIHGGIMNKNYSPFSEYELNIIKYLKTDTIHIVDGAQTVGTVSPKKELKLYIEKILNKLPDNKVYLIVSAADGSKSGKYMSSKVGQLCKNKDELKNILILRGGSIAHYMWFNSLLSGEHVRNAMNRPLLRFPLIKLLTTYRMLLYYFQYIPDINWEDPLVSTDEGILELCKCPKDKCKEYAEYCMNYMKKIDIKKKTK